VIKSLLVSATALVTVACGPVTKTYVVKPPVDVLAEPRTVVFVDSGDAEHTKGLGDVQLDFGERLRSRGFQVKRFAKDDGSIHYGLELRGEIALRCPDGGHRVEWLEVHVIDLKMNEEVMAVGGAGYTEGCFRGGTEGTLYADLASRLLAAWPAGTK
jgi:hypothetical protein